MKDFLHWLAWAAGNIVLLWLAFGLGIPGALNTLLFFAWFCAVIGPLMLSDTTIKALAKKPPYRVRRAISFTLSMVTVGCLAWHEHQVVAAFYAFAAICGASARAQADKLRGAPAVA